ncbi:MAG: metallopeptidase TldD-related protein, partial [Actinomycetota bacterium]|nr:metallopeptidase TldD-related protein [Actinomycetota bacterium]
DGVPVADLELWDDRLAGFATSEKVALALELERRVRAGDARIRAGAGRECGEEGKRVALGGRTSINEASRRTTCYLAADVVAGAGDDTQTGDGFTVGRCPADLDAEAAARDAIERSTRMLGASKPPSARIDVVLDRRVTATLLAILAGTLSGEEVAKGRSLFAGRVGEEVAVERLTLVDDPTDPRAFGAATVDAEGLACRRNALVEGGRLTGFLYDSYSARLAGTRSTGSAVRAGFKSTPGVGARALYLVPGDLDQEGIVALVGEGLLVQGISGVHSGVNPVSGDFSVGAEGLVIRGGSLAEPVREITVASTIQRMLQHVIAVGADVEWLPSSAAGVSLAIGDIAMSGD